MYWEGTQLTPGCPSSVRSGCSILTMPPRSRATISSSGAPTSWLRPGRKRRDHARCLLAGGHLVQLLERRTNRRWTGNRSSRRDDAERTLSIRPAPGLAHATQFAASVCGASGGQHGRTTCFLLLVDGLRFASEVVVCDIVISHRGHSGHGGNDKSVPCAPLCEMQFLTLPR